MAKGVLTGGCVCGAVRYTVDAASAFKPYACHCRDCQTRSGSAFTVQMFVPKDSLKIDGELIEGRNALPGGGVAYQYACAKCLIRIYGGHPEHPIVTLRAGTLDNSDTLVPAAHLWTDSKQSWVVIPNGVPSYPGQPADRNEWVGQLQPRRSAE